VGLVIGGAGKTKGLGALADREVVDPDPAQHLVLDLNQIVGIEEIGVPEEFVGDILRATIQTSFLLEVEKLLLLAFEVGHSPFSMTEL